MQGIGTAEMLRVRDLREKRFTLNQAAHILRIEPELLRKKVDRGSLATSYIQQAGRKIRTIDGIDIVFLRVSDAIAPRVRNALYAQLKHWPDSDVLSGSVAIEMHVAFGNHTVDVPLDRSIRDVVAGIDALHRVEAWAGTRVDQDGTILGTGIKAHRIAALIEGGTSVDDVLRDYPNLTDADVKSSVAFAKANPKQGRPYPVRTVKSALREGQGGLQHAFDAAQAK